jgi:hypothetical protein
MKNVSYLFHLVHKDFIKGLIMAGLVSAEQILYPLLTTGDLPHDMASWQHIGKVSIGAMGLYLLKNFCTNSNDQFAKPEPIPVENPPVNPEKKI